MAMQVRGRCCKARTWVSSRWMTLIQTARLNAIEPMAYLTDVLDRLAEFRDLPEDRKAAKRKQRMIALLPDAWIEGRPDARLAVAR